MTIDYDPDPCFEAEVYPDYFLCVECGEEFGEMPEGEECPVCGGELEGRMDW